MTSIDRPESSSGIASSADDVLTYNYEHFWPKHFVADLLRTSQGAGLRPGSQAPDFDLESTEGDRFRLADIEARGGEDDGPCWSTTSAPSERAR